MTDLDGYRYELHEGNLVITPPSTYWHKVMARRLLLMLHAAGLNVLQDPASAATGHGTTAFPTWAS